MAKFARKAGTTHQIFEIFIKDTASATGGGKTLLDNTSFTCYMIRNKDSAPVAVTLDSSSLVVIGTYEPTTATNGAIKEIDATNMPGLYQFHAPDNGLATGADNVVFMLKPASGSAFQVDPIEIDLTAFDPLDGVRGGLTCLPNAIVNAANGLITNGTGTGQQNNNGGRVDANVLWYNSSPVSPPVTAGVPDVNVKNYNNQTAQTGSNNLPKVGLWSIMGTLITETITGNLAAAFSKFLDVASSTFTAASINQTGDSYARIGATGSSLTSLAPAATALSTANWTNSLATNLTTLAGHDPGGTLATAANQTSILNAVNAITTNTARTSIVVPAYQPLPPSGSTVIRVRIKLFNLEGVLEDADSNTVTVHASTAAGASLDANLSSTTATRDSAGNYHVDYTVHAADAEGGVYIAVTYTIGSVAMAADAVFAVTQADTVASIATILSTVTSINSNVGTAGAGLTAIGDARLSHLNADVSTRAATGDKMDIVDTPNNTAIAALQNGLATHTDANTILAAVNGITLPSNALDVITIETGMTNIVDDAGNPLTSINLRQAMALITAFVGGKAAGGQTPIITFAPAGKPSANPRITTSGDDSKGNRPAVSLRVPI